MLHLVVAEQEDGGRGGAARLHQHLFQVLPPLWQAVVLGDLDVEELVVGQEGGQAGQALTATATNTNLCSIVRTQSQGIANAQL